MNSLSKKLLITLIAGICLSLGFSAFQPAQTLSHRISFLASQWDNIASETNLNSDHIHSWIPESGIRGRYEIAKSVLSIHTLEGIVGEPVFLNGPHSSGINYQSKTEFGYYNPEFINQLRDMLEMFSKRKNFVSRSQSFYDTHFKNYLRVYYLAYSEGYNNQEVMDGYQTRLAKASESDGDYPPHSEYIQEAFRPFAESLEKQGYDVYEGFNCPGFWVRRSIDGTGDEFYNLLTLALQTYDPGFVNK